MIDDEQVRDAIARAREHGDFEAYRMIGNGVLCEVVPCTITVGDENLATVALGDELYLMPAGDLVAAIEGGKQ